MSITYNFFINIRIFILLFKIIQIFFLKKFIKRTRCTKLYTTVLLSNNQQGSSPPACQKSSRFPWKMLPGGKISANSSAPSRKSKVS